MDIYSLLALFISLVGSGKVNNQNMELGNSPFSFEKVTLKGTSF